MDMLRAKGEAKQLAEKICSTAEARVQITLIAGCE